MAYYYVCFCALLVFCARVGSLPVEDIVVDTSALATVKPTGLATNESLRFLGLGSIPLLDQVENVVGNVVSTIGGIAGKLIKQGLHTVLQIGPEILDLVGIRDGKGMLLPMFATECICYKTYCACCCPSVPVPGINWCGRIRFGLSPLKLSVEVTLEPHEVAQFRLIPDLTDKENPPLPPAEKFPEPKNLGLRLHGNTMPNSIPSNITDVPGRRMFLTSLWGNLVSRFINFSPVLLGKRWFLISMDLIDFTQPEDPRVCAGFIPLKGCMVLSKTKTVNGVIETCMSARMSILDIDAASAFFGCIKMGESLNKVINITTKGVEAEAKDVDESFPQLKDEKIKLEYEI